MYPSIPNNRHLSRLHFVTADGDGHAYVLWGGVNISDSEDPNSIADADFSDFNTNWMPHLSTSYTSNDVHTVARWNDGTLHEGDSSGSPVPGSNGDPVVPPQVSLLCRKETGIIGREGRGRLYVPGLSLSQIGTDATFIDPTHLAIFQTAANDFLAGLVSHGHSMVLLHRNPAVLPYDVTALVVESQIATQRRRNRKAPHH